MKTVFPGMEISILVRWHLYIETVPRGLGDGVGLGLGGGGGGGEIFIIQTAYAARLMIAHRRHVTAGT